MSLRARRFAGARLAAQPLQAIPEQLQTALKNLRDQNIVNSKTPVGDDFPDYISKHRDVRGSTKKVHLLADPRRADLGDYIPEDLSNVPANLAALEQLVANPPRAVYDLSWDVDGSYGGDKRTGRREAMRIAREAERGWQEIIPTLEEGSLVKNMPVGASAGDYERADLYMKYGFGPVQENGLQFGQVLDGRIVPISPTLPDLQYMEHLAQRAKGGGELELANELNANAKALQKLTGDVKVMSSKRDVSGAQEYYDDYDSPYEGDWDYDYEPELTIDDLSTREEATRRLQGTFNDLNSSNSPEFSNGVSPIEMRERAKAEFNPERLTNEVEGPDGMAVQHLRNAQIALNQNVRANNIPAALQEISPRPLPPTLEVGEVRRRATRPVRRGESGLRNLPASERRQILAADLGLGTSEYDPLQRAIDVRESGKRNMIDMQRPDDGSIGRIMQEQYTDTDVANLRNLQEAFASIPNRYPPEVFSETPRRPGVNPNFVQHGDRIQNRRALTPEQQAAQRELEPFLSAEADITAELNMFEESMTDPGRRGQAIRNQRGGGRFFDIISGIQPNPEMPGRRALEILHRENSQPGTVDLTELGQAVVNLQRIRDGGFSSVRRAAEGPQSILDAANRGPMAPIQRVTARRVTPPNPPDRSNNRNAQTRSSDRWNTAPLVPDYDTMPF